MFVGRTGAGGSSFLVRFQKFSSFFPLFPRKQREKMGFWKEEQEG